jgi:hypothetical protein
MAERKFLDFMDRFDGGGAGQSGDKFEGGGLLSLLGNLIASPYGSEDEARRAERMKFFNKMNPAPAAPVAPPAMMSRPTPRPMATEPNYADRFALPPMPVQPNYNVRSDYGMPAAPVTPNYAVRNDYGLPMGQTAQGVPNYPMSLPRPSADAPLQEIEAYLRSIGYPGY